MAARKLSSLGYLVIAGCLTAEGSTKIKDGSVVSIVCDVTKEKDLEELARVTEKYCTDNKKKLWAVVNNAGFPNGGPYCGSKHAVEGMSKCLRQELRPWNIFVCNINPGFMRTPLLTTSHLLAVKEFNEAPKSITDQYDLTTLNKLNETIQSLQENPQLVIDAIVDNMTYAQPALVNAVGWQGFFVSWLRLAPEWLNNYGEDMLNRAAGLGPKKGLLEQIQTK
eukprot:gene26167-32702_t